MRNTELYHYGVKGMRWGVRNDSIVSSKKRRPQFGAKTDGYQKAKFPSGTIIDGPGTKKTKIKSVSKASSRGKKIVGAIIGGTALAGIGIAAVRGAKYSKIINAGKDLIKNLDTNISILNNR